MLEHNLGWICEALVVLSVSSFTFSLFAGTCGHHFCFLTRMHTPIQLRSIELMGGLVGFFFCTNVVVILDLALGKQDTYL
jgi:hypothetical protein